MLTTVSANCEEINWPDTPVWIISGASGVNEAVPDGVVDPSGNPLSGSFIGGSYTSYGEAAQFFGRQIINVGQGGAFSFDIPGTPWIGYVSQVTKGINAAQWVDGNHAKYVVIGQMNDCFAARTIEDLCDEVRMDFYVNNAVQAADLARSHGLEVIVHQLMPYERLDILKALAPYGFNYEISAEDYAVLVSKHEAAFKDRTDIHYTDPYKRVNTIDGLHPDFLSQMYAAFIDGCAVR